MKFKELPLHDATLLSISKKWEEKLAVVEGQTYNLESKEIENFILTFFDVNFIELTHKESWGPSSQINSTKSEVKNEFIIEMQSGDSIRISAERFTFKQKST